MIYSKIGGLTAPLPPNPPAAMFASQGDAHVRIDAQIKFLYYPLAHVMCDRPWLLLLDEVKFGKILRTSPSTIFPTLESKTKRIKYKVTITSGSNTKIIKDRTIQSAVPKVFQLLIMETNRKANSLQVILVFK